MTTPLSNFLFGSPICEGSEDDPVLVKKLKDSKRTTRPLNKTEESVSTPLTPLNFTETSVHKKKETYRGHQKEINTDSM